MGLLVIENNYGKYISKFNKYFKDTLINPKKIIVQMSEYGFRDRNTLKIYFREEYVYCGYLKINNKQTYFFGLGSKALKKKDLKRISPSFAIYFDNQFKNSCIVFGKENNEIFVLMRIDYSKLSDQEESFLLDKFSLIEHKGIWYINFGSLSQGNDILENLRNFIYLCRFDKKHHNFIKIISIKILYDFNNNFDSSNDKCELCGGKILETYDANPKITECVGINSKICLNCFSKILMSYFKSKIGNYSNKSYLLSSVKNKKLIMFYLNLAEITGIMDRDYEIIFKENLKDYENYFQEIPEKLIIEEIPNGYKGVNNIINKIDAITLEYDDLSKDFKKRLFDNNLSEDDGWDIREKLIAFAKDNDLKNTKKSINFHIKELISEKSENHKQYNILNLAKKLKELTLGYGSNLNEEFVDKLKANGIDPDEGFNIRSQIVDEIDNKVITDVDQIEIRLNELIYEYGAQQGTENSVGDKILKEYLLMNDLLIIKSIIPKYELNDLIEMLNYMKGYSLSLDSLIILEFDEKFSKVFVEFKVKGIDFKFEEILKYNCFKNLNLDGD